MRRSGVAGPRSRSVYFRGHQRLTAVLGRPLLAWARVPGFVAGQRQFSKACADYWGVRHRLKASLLFLAIAFGTSACDHGGEKAKRETSPFTDLATWNAEVHTKLVRRFKQPLGRVDCTARNASSPDHLFCFVYGPTSYQGWGPDNCSAQGFDAYRRNGVLIVRDAVEQYYCIRNTGPGDGGTG